MLPLPLLLLGLLLEENSDQFVPPPLVLKEAQDETLVALVEVVLGVSSVQIYSVHQRFPFLLFCLCYIYENRSFLSQCIR